MIEPLKHLLSIYPNKKKELLYYLSKDIQSKVKDLLYLDDDNNELLLNDKLFCIKRSTLELEHSGRLIYKKYNKISLKEKNYSIHLSINDYYIFIKRNKTKNNDKLFYQELLKLL